MALTMFLQMVGLSSNTCRRATKRLQMNVSLNQKESTRLRAFQFHLHILLFFFFFTSHSECLPAQSFQCYGGKGHVQAMCGCKFSDYREGKELLPAKCLGDSHMAQFGIHLVESISGA
uniref:Uncharacterized protein n=1 Tax=Oryza brachyantha TaxID=4533 RepID=J3LDT6_ORYBR